MINIFGINFISYLKDSSMEDEEWRIVIMNVMIVMIINSIICLFIVLLNLLVIMVV